MFFEQLEYHVENERAVGLSKGLRQQKFLNNNNESLAVRAERLRGHGMTMRRTRRTLIIASKLKYSQFIIWNRLGRVLRRFDDVVNGSRVISPRNPLTERRRLYYEQPNDITPVRPSRGNAKNVCTISRHEQL